MKLGPTQLLFAALIAFSIAAWYEKGLGEGLSVVGSGLFLLAIHRMTR